MRTLRRKNIRWSVNVETVEHSPCQIRPESQLMEIEEVVEMIDGNVNEYLCPALRILHPNGGNSAIRYGGNSTTRSIVAIPKAEIRSGLV